MFTEEPMKSDHSVFKVARLLRHVALSRRLVKNFAGVSEDNARNVAVSVCWITDCQP